jgi:hypothetical protein
MIHEEICTYEVAKLARDKGFNVQTFDWYDYTGNYNKGFIPHKLHECPRYKEYYAPTQSLLQRWLREEKGVIIEVICLPTTRTSSKYEYKRHLFWGSDGHYLESEYGDEIFDTYELALEDALKYALENLV